MIGERILEILFGEHDVFLHILIPFILTFFKQYNNEHSIKLNHLPMLYHSITRASITYLLICEDKLKLKNYLTRELK